jgi:nucleoside phosphorylase
VTESNERCDLLIVAAFAPELQGFRGLLGPALSARVGELVVAARPVGIGLVSAASGTAVRLARMQPRAVVLVGTCGAYPGKRLGLGDVVVARSILLLDPAVLDDEAAFPDPMSARVEAHAAMSAAIAAAGGRIEDVGTTLAVTTSDPLAARLGRESGAAVEHLEAFAVATACAMQRVPFAAVLGVANTAGSTGRTDWRTHQADAGLAVGRFVASWAQAGAAGVPHQVEVD